MENQEIKRELERRAVKYAEAYRRQYNCDEKILKAVCQSHYVALVTQLIKVLRDKEL